MIVSLPPRLARLRAFHAARDPERVALKYERLRRDPLAFLRGTNVLFQEDWALRAGALRTGPLAWQCGDLHAENVGAFRGGNRLSYFDVNDFDDAVLAPVLLDITRLCTSVLVAAELYAEPHPGGSEGTAMAAHLVATYRSTLAEGKAWWIERGTATGLVRDLLRGLERRGEVRRARRQFFKARVRLRKRRLRVDGVHALPSPEGEGAIVAEAVRAALESTAPGLVVHDVARRVAGNGSLGVPRWVLLVEGADEDGGIALLDAKQPEPSPAVLHAPLQPAWRSEAERVVGVQRLMQAAPPALLHVAPFKHTALVVRELQPREDRVRLDLAINRPRALRRLLEQMAQLCAWSQLRASGWYGASAGDALQAFARRGNWERDVIAYAVRAAGQVRQDWSAFVESQHVGRLAAPAIT